VTATQIKSDTTPGVRRTRIPGEPGVWVLIFGDLLVFGIIFVAFMHARSADPDVFNRSQQTLQRAFGGANTLLLLTSSLLVVLAVSAIRRGMASFARRLLFSALLCAAVFLGNKAIEWTSLITEGHTPALNSYYMYFFVMTGLHAAHVVLGAILLVAIAGLSRKGALSHLQIGLVESFGCFWHLVDMLWLVIFPLLYLMH
jgi:nitric oxide reductase NorE protein